MLLELLLIPIALMITPLMFLPATFFILSITSKKYEFLHFLVLLFSISISFFVITAYVMLLIGRPLAYFHILIISLPINIVTGLIWIRKSKPLPGVQYNLEPLYVFAIFLMIFIPLLIPALKYPWYGGYGIDWTHHYGMVNSVIAGSPIYDNYPYLGSHLILGFVKNFGFDLRNVLQISTAFFIALAVFPVYILGKKLGGIRIGYISAMLYTVIPYHYRLYGEFIPQSISIFFVLTILFILYWSIVEKNPSIAFLAGTMASASFQIHLLAAIIPFLIIILFLIFQFFKYRKNPAMKEVFFMSLKSFGFFSLTSFIFSIPFLMKTFQRSQTIFNDFAGEKFSIPSIFNLPFPWILSISNDFGMVPILLVLIGLMELYKKRNEINRIMDVNYIYSLTIISFLLTQLYLIGYWFWAFRYFFVWQILSVFVMAFAFIRIPRKIAKVVFVLFIVFLSSWYASFVIDMNEVEPIWSKEIQDVISWCTENANDKNTVFLLLNYTGDANSVFKEWMDGCTKTVFAENLNKPFGTLVHRNKLASIYESGDKFYIEFKMNNVGKSNSKDYKNFSNTIPRRRLGLLEDYAKAHIWIYKLDQSQSESNGYGLDIYSNRSIGQTFRTGKGVDKLSMIRIYLTTGKSKPTDSLRLRLYDSPLKKVIIEEYTIPERQVSTTWAWHEFRLGTIFSPGISPDAQYYFEVTSSTDSENPYYVLNAGSDKYVQGGAYINEQALADDLMFETTYWEFLS